MISSITTTPPRPQTGQLVCITVQSSSPVNSIAVGSLGGTPTTLPVSSPSPGVYEICFTWPPGGVGGLSLMNVWITAGGVTTRRLVVGA